MGLWLVVRLCVYVYALARLRILGISIGINSVLLVCHVSLAFKQTFDFFQTKNLASSLYMSTNNWFLIEQYWIQRQDNDFYTRGRFWIPISKL